MLRKRSPSAHIGAMAVAQVVSLRLMSLTCASHPLGFHITRFRRLSTLSDCPSVAFLWPGDTNCSHLLLAASALLSHDALGGDVVLPLE